MDPIAYVVVDDIVHVSGEVLDAQVLTERLPPASLSCGSGPPLRWWMAFVDMRLIVSKELLNYN